MDVFHFVAFILSEAGFLVVVLGVLSNTHCNLDGSDLGQKAPTSSQTPNMTHGGN